MLAVLAVGFALSAPAQAAFPGQNGKIVFAACATDCGLFTMNSDGTARTQITHNPVKFFNGSCCWIYGEDTTPQWSPGGNRIVFMSSQPVDGPSGPSSQNDLAIVDPDGSAQTLLTNTAASESFPAWSPDGTEIAFIRSERLWVVNADGTGEHQVTDSQTFAPDWSPDGTKILYVRNAQEGGFTTSQIHSIHPDGINDQELTSFDPGAPAGNTEPTWSPDGQRIAFVRFIYPSPCCSQAGDLFVMNADGSNRVQLTNTNPPGGSIGERHPAWSPDGQRIVFDRDGPDNIYAIDVTGGSEAQLTTAAGRDLFPDWQPIPINSYPRPKGATPFLTYLVPAYNACGSPNRQHGPPLAFASCNPPTRSSSDLTIGSADSNGKPTKSVSSVRFNTLVGIPSTTADEADVKITAQVIDVYTQADLNDYAGEVTAKTTLRITDKLNTPHPGGPGAGTVSDIPYGFTIPCAATADPAIGGACLLSTSADALAPGAVKEGRRAIWGLGQVAVYDANNAPFMKQGIFVP